jgi:hypothetical protein
MSNQLSLAAVTCVLQDLLTPSMEIIPGAVVSTVRPDKMAQGGKMTRGLNIYLYRVTPNTQFRNVDMPLRSSDGAFQQAPIIAVDMHYLISAYGDETMLEPQILLGAAVARLHEHTTLGQELVEDGIETSAHIVEGSDLADQQPRVKIYMENLSTEDLSKIWSVLFQTSYSLSGSYVLGPVFLHTDVEVPARAPAVARTNIDRVDVDNDE